MKLSRWRMFPRNINLSIIYELVTERIPIAAITQIQSFDKPGLNINPNINERMKANALLRLNLDQVNRLMNGIQLMFINEKLTPSN